MKVLIVFASLLLNAALLATLVYRPSLAPAVVRDFIVQHRSAAGAETGAARKAPPKPPAKLWTQLQTEDLPALVARLRAAGFPPNVIRSLIRSLVDARYASRLRALREPDPNVPYWQQRPFFMWFGDKRYVEMEQLQRERSKLMRDLLNDPVLAETGTTPFDRRRYGNLSPAKVEMIRRIEEDYNDMISPIRAAMGGIELPEDREKLALLAKEKRADLASVLTPDELSEFEMRTSHVTSALRDRMTAFDATEAEFRSIFQAYQALGEKFGTRSSMMSMDWTSREEIQNGLSNQLRAGLGDARYAEFVRDASDDYRQMLRLTKQQQLPTDTPERAYALTERVAQQSRQIADNTALSREERRDALKALAQNARADLAVLFPGEAGQSYVNRVSWLAYLERGTAIEIAPKPPLIIASDSGMTSYSSGTLVVPANRRPVKQ
jgi:hypothetical protein